MQRATLGGRIITSAFLVAALAPFRLSIAAFSSLSSSSQQQHQQQQTYTSTTSFLFSRSHRKAFPGSTQLAMSTTPAPTLQEGDALFGKFVIPNASIFYRSELSYAFVNLRPIVPGHVLVSPIFRPTDDDNAGRRPPAHLSDLSEESYQDLWQTVRQVQSLLQKQYGPTCAFNVAVQDGRASGQSVPHVHVHLLPRIPGDYERNDDIYDDLQHWAPRPELAAPADLQVPDDHQRRDRTRDEMDAEAAQLRALL